MLRFPLAVWLVAAILGFSNASAQEPIAPRTIRDFGAVGDGTTDDTAAIQKAVDAKLGHIVIPPGRYRLTSTILVDLDRVGYTSIAGSPAAQLIMTGPGPAVRFIGTHEGTAAPRTFKPNVWERQRTPSVDGLEIVGAHAEACGIEASGTMQLTLTRVVIREALHGVHLVNRNRNVTLAACNLYNNRGIGLFLDGVDLHQINVANCHISYNHGGGVVARGSELRNLQIGSSDIEANMGGPGSAPTANVLLDSTGGSIAEVAIVGCSIQHAHDAPDSANIRILGKSKKLKHTDELRWGHVTIADNVLSDVHVNLDLAHVRGATISGNTMWQGYTHNMTIRDCANLVVANNLLERNPRYHSGDAASARLGVVFENCTDCTLTGNHFQGIDCEPAALVLKNCGRMNLTGGTILDYGACGVLLENLTHSRVSDLLIRDDRPGSHGFPLRLTSGRGNFITGNLFDRKPDIADGTATETNNIVESK